MTKKKTGNRNEIITIIVPCYNEEDVIRLCHETIAKTIQDLPYEFELIYINDGSGDRTLEILREINAADKRARVLNLSRNFGKEAAMTAGIDASRGDALIILDADLQDPPALIPELIKIWKEQNADVVYGQRVEREGETWLKKTTASAFYKIINSISAVDIPYNTGDFRLMNRRAVEALKKLREHHRFMKGLFAWIGYRQVALQYNREPRAAGTTKWNYWKLSNFAIEGITSFSIAPLRLATFFGCFISILGFGFGAFVFFKTLFFGRDLPGYASLAIILTFFSGIQLLTIGILGEYIGRIFGETKNRPLYFIEEEL